MPYPNEHACRLREPGDGAKRRKNGAAKIDGREVDHIYEIADGRSTLQSVRFRREAGWGTPAATAIARDWCREQKGKWEPMVQQAGHAETPVALFVTDVQMPRYQVRVVETPDGTELRDLPIIRTGKWNDREFTEADLRALVANFATIRSEDQVVPALKSRHTYGPNGPENVDAGEVVLGWFTALRYDEATGVVFGDVAVVDPDLVANMQSGRLRYISAEVARGYELADGDEALGPALVGAAFVDWPAVKGLPWELVLNRADFGADTVGKEGRVRRANGTTERKGGTGMGQLIDTLKRILLGQADPEELEAYRDVVPNMAVEPAPQTAQKAPAEDPEVVTLRAQVAELNAARAEAEAEVARLSAAYRETQVTALMHGLLEGGHVAPAQEPAVRALVDALLASGQRVTLPGDGDGEPAERPAVEVLVEALKASSPGGRLVGPPGRTYTDETDGKAYTAEQLDALVQSLRAPASKE